jgi:protease-4
MANYDPTATPIIKAQSGWKTFFLTVLGVVVGMLVVLPILFFVIAGLIGAALSSASSSANAAKAVTDETVLVLDLRSGLIDHSAGETLFGDNPSSVVNTVRAIDAASRDDRIKGIFVRAGFSGMAPASAEEISEALEEFKESEKFVLGFAQGLENPTLTSYAPLAPAEIWMQASTSFAVSGMQTEAEYYRGVFDKVGIDPEFVQFHEYKSAADTYDETGMTEPVREATEAWLGSVHGELITDIARQRGLSEVALTEALSRTPLSAEDAEELGLVNKLGYYEEAVAYAKELAGSEDAKMLNIDDYTVSNGKYSGPVIAMIGGQGTIVPGGSTPSNPFSGGTVFGSDSIAKAFDDAIDNDKTKAILFRVSSPGGSAAASDQIDAAVRRAKAKGIPVVVSMGQYAASGGYYVSANADYIYAQPTTITGSIGVLGGKIALEGAFDKVGYNIDSVSVGGPYTGAYSANTPFTDYQEEGFRSQMAEIYEDFTGVVAAGRDMPIEQVKEIAKGRVWSGAQAHELGLVDELGGFYDALAKARELAEIGEDEEIYLRRYPKPKTVEEQLSSLFSTSAQTSADLDALRALIQTEEVQAILRARAAMDAQSNMDGQLRARLPKIVE